MSLPYISCSSIGSTVSSSSLPEFEEAGTGSNGSFKYVEDGIELAKSPSEFCLSLGDDIRRLRVGRSEALRMVGLAFRTSDMIKARLSCELKPAMLFERSTPLPRRLWGTEPVIDKG